MTTLRKHLKEAHGKRPKKAADRDEKDINVDLEEVALRIKHTIAPSTKNTGSCENTFSNVLGAKDDESVRFDLNEFVSFGLGTDAQKKEKEKPIFGGENYGCTECSKFYGTYIQFKAHLNKVHEDTKTDCQIYKKRLKSKSDLEFTCFICIQSVSVMYYCEHRI